MSKTYRRTREGQKTDWLPNIDEYDVYGGGKFGYRWPPDEKAVEWLAANPHRIKDLGDWFHDGVPSDWYNWTHTRRARAQARALEKKIVRDEVDPDNVVWPHWKKPVIYYW